jgi:hypothetical protein
MGILQPIKGLEFRHSGLVNSIRQTFSLGINPVLGSEPAEMPQPAAEAPGPGNRVASLSRLENLPPELPVLALQAESTPPASAAPEAELAPPAECPFRPGAELLPAVAKTHLSPGVTTPLAIGRPGLPQFGLELLRTAVAEAPRGTSASLPLSAVEGDPQPTLDGFPPIVLTPGEVSLPQFALAPDRAAASAGILAPVPVSAGALDGEAVAYARASDKTVDGLPAPVGPGEVNLPRFDPEPPPLAAAEWESGPALVEVPAAEGNRRMAGDAGAAFEWQVATRRLEFGIAAISSRATLVAAETPLATGMEPALPEMHAITGTGRAEWPIPAASQPRFMLRALGEVSGVPAAPEGAQRLTPTPSLCGVCVPGPTAEPALCRVEPQARTEWQWPAPALAAPAVPTAGAIRLEPREEWSFASTPEPEAVEVLLTAAGIREPAGTSVGIVLPSGLERVAQTAEVPLARAAASLEARPQARHNAAAAANWKHIAGAVSENRGVREPRIPELWGSGAAEWMTGPMPAAAVACASDAEPVESLSAIRPAVGAITHAFALCYPKFSLSEHALTATVPGAEQSRPPMVAAVAGPPVSVPLCLVSGTDVAAPRHHMEAAVSTAIPSTGVVPIEFFCARASAAPSRNLNYIRPTPDLAFPKLPLTVVGEALEARVAPQTRPKKDRNAAAEVFRLPEARRRRRLPDLVSPLAACFLAGAFLWLAAKTLHVATETPALSRDVATAMERGNAGSSSKTGGAQNGSTPAGAQQQPGLMARVHRAIAGRAALQLSESFHEGMAAWSDGHTAPAGWTRSADGYVRPAAFALFRPSLDFHDYRMEFLGQIEQKSMSWAVRAHDSKNYFAMKVHVVEPGLRPMVAIEHYPVVGGRKGRRTETPLPNVMFHNNTPYHVEVAIRGNRVITSIEGQEVDSWTDDMPSKGGVGFFADAGERARIYWMKVSRNEDLLGRICAYITRSESDASITTGSLWPNSTQGLPGEGAPAGPGWPIQNTEIALASAFAPRGFERRRFRSWKS